MKRFKKTYGLIVAASCFLAAAAAQGQTHTIDFSSFSDYTPIPAGQFAAEGVTFTAVDALGNIGAPGTVFVPETIRGGVSNSPTGEYPTTQYLEVKFQSPVVIDSFIFNNEGDKSNTYSAYSKGGSLLGTGSVQNLEGSNPLTLNLSGVSSLVFDNTTTGPGQSWIFELDSITFVAAQVDLSLALDLRGITLGVLETATRDVNGRLFRLRMRGDGSDSVESPGGKDLVNVGADGKQSVSVKQPEPASRLQFFAQGDFSTTNQNSSDGVSGFGGQTEAGTVGIEYALNSQLTTGLAIGYVHNYTNIHDGATDSLNIDGLVASAYASWFKDNFYLDGLYSFSYLENYLRSSAGNEVATAQPSTFGNTLELNAGYNLVRPWVVTGPIAALNYTHGDIDDFTATSGASVQSQNFNSLVSQVGWQASFPRTTHQGMLTRVTPQLHAAWAHEYMNNSESVSANFNGFSTTGNTPQPERDYAAVGAGIMAEFGKDFSVTLDYQADIGSMQVTNFVSARGEIKF